MFNKCVAVVLACIGWASVAIATDIPADLRKAVEDYDHAQVKADGAELRRLVADDYVLVNSSGKVQNKSELIADYLAPGYKIEPFDVLEPVEKAWTDGAVMGGLVHLKGTSEGKPFAVTLRFADIWAKRNGKWQVVYTHVSVPPQPSSSG
ncbi:MAG TPA: nuclear transport factor 2 family protein [Steroidobacter sp.]